MTIDGYGVLESSLGLAVGGVLLRLFDRFCHKCCNEEVQTIAAIAAEREAEHTPSESDDEDETERTMTPPNFFPEKENLQDSIY